MKEKYIIEVGTIFSLIKTNFRQQLLAARHWNHPNGRVFSIEIRDEPRKGINLVPYTITITLPPGRYWCHVRNGSGSILYHLSPNAAWGLRQPGVVDRSEYPRLQERVDRINEAVTTKLREEGILP